MPGLGATDPADLEAQARAELGFSRRLEQPRRILPYPGFGGGGGYPVWYREQQLQRFNAGEATSEAAPCPLQPCYFAKWDILADT